MLLLIAEHINFKGKNKHFELRWSFICEFIERGIVRVEKIPGRLQLADLGTGARPFPLHLWQTHYHTR